MKKLIFITLILFSVNSIAEDQVQYWQSFHSEMTPQDVADELNKMDLVKDKVKVKKMPKKPKYITKGYNWIPIITESRINDGSPIGIDFNGYHLSGPFFRFDEEDELAEVRLGVRSVPNGSSSFGCRNLLKADGEKAFKYLSDALQIKYEFKREDINYEDDWWDSESIRVFSDGETRVWLVMKKRYEKSLSTDMFKCNKDVANVVLYYSDWQRIETKMKAYNAQAAKDTVEDVMNTL